MPHGDTCPFCITLASNGWQKASSKVLKGGHADHIHANCDCEFAIRFDHNTTVAGYDPDKYLKQYRDAGGDINKMRRVNYAANKERINAQKRAAYAVKNALPKSQTLIRSLKIRWSMFSVKRPSRGLISSLRSNKTLYKNIHITPEIRDRTVF